VEKRSIEAVCADLVDVVDSKHATGRPQSSIVRRRLASIEVEFNAGGRVFPAEMPDEVGKGDRFADGLCVFWDMCLCVCDNVL